MTELKNGHTESELKRCISEMVKHTDLYPWYCYSYGEKCYAFAVVECYPVYMVASLVCDEFKNLGAKNKIQIETKFERELMNKFGYERTKRFTVCVGWMERLDKNRTFVL